MPPDGRKHKLQHQCQHKPAQSQKSLCSHWSRGRETEAPERGFSRPNSEKCWGLALMTDPRSLFSQPAALAYSSAGPKSLSIPQPYNLSPPLSRLLPQFLPLGHCRPVLSCGQLCVDARPVFMSDEFVFLSSTKSCVCLPGQLTATFFMLETGFPHMKKGLVGGRKFQEPTVPPAA